MHQLLTPLQLRAHGCSPSLEIPLPSHATQQMPQHAKLSAARPARPSFSYQRVLAFPALLPESLTALAALSTRTLPPSVGQTRLRRHAGSIASALKPSSAAA